MKSFQYSQFRERLFAGEFNWEEDLIEAHLVSPLYNPNPADKRLQPHYTLASTVVTNKATNLKRGMARRLWDWLRGKKYSTGLCIGKARFPQTDDSFQVGGIVITQGKLPIAFLNYSFHADYGKEIEVSFPDGIIMSLN